MQRPVFVKVEIEEAYEIIRAGSGTGPAFLTCEHASARLPEPWEWKKDDRWIVDTHWAHDIGARDLTADLAGAMGSVAVLSRFTRLLADPNRDEQHVDLFRRHAEGRVVRLNEAIDDDERRRRLDRLYRPYHAAIDRELARSEAQVVLSVHTFTPTYEGRQRDVEVGVLFDEEVELAGRLNAAIERTGLRARLNEPYSGRAGMIHAADRHGRTHGRRAIEIEVRQDLVTAASVREEIAKAIGATLG